MKILYIDNRNYHHNQNIHIDFFSFIHNKKYHTIYPYGLYLHKFFKNAIKPGDNPNYELNIIADKIKPAAIITYNCNGSSYEVGLDNVNLYKWCEDFLQKTKIPKFHITTDYLRSGFKQEQADWFNNLNYSAALFRHKVALDFPIKVPAYWLPFSVDKDMFMQNSITNIKYKENKVAFVGAAHNSSKSLYINRIAAIDFLMSKDKMAITRVLDKKSFARKILFGKEYINFLSKYLFGLTCGGTCNFMTAKYFQIPAAYSMLVCTDTVGLDIFPKDTYIIYHKDNMNDLLDQINYYEKNLKEAKNKIASLNKYVLENHDHHQRSLELTKIIKSHI